MLQRDINYIQEKLATLKEEPNTFMKTLRAMAYISYLFDKEELLPIIVGGHAVEIYTLGQYTTMDIDLVCIDYQGARSILEAIDFRKEGPGFRHWYHKQLDIAIEIPDSTLAGSQEKVITVEVEDGFHIYVIGIEDLILDRLRAATYWKSSSDKEWALFLLTVQWQDVDFSYLHETAAKETSQLRELLDQLKLQAKDLLKN